MYTSDTQSFKNRNFIATMMQIINFKILIRLILTIDKNTPDT